eukprot:TRINITY_DN37322_c0_g1_i1.p1 TRINITY_DN37322_c0_g1~~TRINITY_DN37322_c0_g1_i1.p1  ORF type:complete len:134 (-),score=19.72 TRINITY_DN37322_c0_g1_i1:147-548(-)
MASNLRGRLVRFPNYVVRLARESYEQSAKTNKLTFIVPPQMGKADIKEYLTKIYGMDVTKVNTMNYEGRFKRGKGKNPLVNHRFQVQADYKKAIVTLGTYVTLPGLPEALETAIGSNKEATEGEKTTRSADAE